MKKSIIIVPIILILALGFIFLNGETGPVDRRELFTEHKDESIYIEDGTLYFEKDGKAREIDSFDGELEALSWSGDGRYFSLDSHDRTYIYSRESLKHLKDFRTNGRSIFSEDSSRILLGLREEDTNDLAIYNLESGYIEPILEGGNKEVYLPLAWNGDEISYLEENSQKEASLKLVESKEDRLMKLVKEDGEPAEILGLLGDVNREEVYRKYGDESIVEVLSFLSSKNITGLEEMKKAIEISDGFVGEEHYEYVELLGTMYLANINNFIKALTSHEGKTKEIAYDLHDLKLYDREGSDLTEDLNNIIMSKELDAREKKVGMDIISTYADCGA